MPKCTFLCKLNKNIVDLYENIYPKITLLQLIH